MAINILIYVCIYKHVFLLKISFIIKKNVPMEHISKGRLKKILEQLILALACPSRRVLPIFE